MVWHAQSSFKALFSLGLGGVLSSPATASPLALIVDDHADTREMYALYLVSEGFQVVEADDCEQALGKAMTFLPDVIATDLRLTDGSGMQLCRRLKEQDGTKAIPIIAVTGLAMPGDVQSALASGCVSVLVKPCLPDTLLREIKRVLDLPHTLPKATRA